MKKGKLVLMLVFLVALCVSCGNKNSELPSSSNAVNSSNETPAYSIPEKKMQNIETIDDSITALLMESGYSVEHASKIQEILNTLGIDTISIDNMTGEAEKGLNSVVCCPNGLTDRDKRFFFTTEDGELFYAGFSEEDLYDSNNGGFIKSYNDVHIPNKEVSLDTYNVLCQLAEDAVKNCLNYPETANFHTLSWKIGRSDEKYQIKGEVTAKNGFGVKEKIGFSVWFTDLGDSFNIDGISLDGVRVK